MLAIRGSLGILALVLAMGGTGCDTTADDDSGDDDAGDDDGCDDDSGDDGVADDDTSDDDTGDDDDSGEPDLDGDGLSVAGGDCNDADPLLLHAGDGATLRVPQNHVTIQAAIDAAVDCDAIVVAPGVYAEFLDFSGKAIAVTGEGGWGATTLQPPTGEERSLVTFASGEPPAARLEGFTLIGGTARDGAGVRVHQASPTLRGLWIEGCNASVETIDGSENPGYGGGISLDHSAATVEQVVLVGNQANFGGGLCARASSPTLSHLLVASNSASSFVVVWVTSILSGGSGGGLYLETSTASLHHLALLGNGAQGGEYFTNGTGGGVAIVDSTAWIDHAAVVGNHAVDGGGLWASESEVAVTSSVLSGNAGLSYGGDFAGGIAREGCEPQLFRCGLWDNQPCHTTGAWDPFGGGANLEVDPGFLDTTGELSVTWDLHLTLDSALIDAGDPGLVDPDGGPDDIGLYGGSAGAAWDLDLDGYPAWWRPGPYDALTSPGTDCDDLSAEVYPGQGC